jgi:hypothetical protein
VKIAVQEAAHRLGGGAAQQPLPVLHRSNRVGSQLRQDDPGLPVHPTYEPGEAAVRAHRSHGEPNGLPDKGIRALVAELLEELLHDENSGAVAGSEQDAGEGSGEQLRFERLGGQGLGPGREHRVPRRDRDVEIVVRVGEPHPGESGELLHGLGIEDHPGRVVVLLLLRGVDDDRREQPHLLELLVDDPLVSRSEREHRHERTDGDDDPRHRQ